MDEALRRVTGAQLAQLMFPRFDARADAQLLAKGMNASPGAAVGKAVFDSATAVAWAERGESVILVRRRPTPTTCTAWWPRAGSSPAAAARPRTPPWWPAAWAAPACAAPRRSTSTRRPTDAFTVRGGTTIAEGDVDLASTARPARCSSARCPVVDSLGRTPLRGRRAASRRRARGCGRPASWSTRTRRGGSQVRANADTAEDAARARRFGAQGIGLCRTEHMFLGDRQRAGRAPDPRRDDEEQEKALAELLPLQREDFVEILQAMDGLPVTIRLIDPPLHEFLPDYHRSGGRGRAWPTSAARPDASERKLLAAVKRLHEENPMLGLRGVRLGIVIPGPVRHAGPGDPRGRGRRGSRPAVTRVRRS